MTDHNAAWHETRAEILLDRINAATADFRPTGNPETYAATASAHAQLAISLRLAEVAARPPSVLSGKGWQVNNSISAAIGEELRKRQDPPAGDS